MANPSAAPAPFAMGGVDYLMSPLTDRDIQELNNFIRQEILTTAREFCKSETNKAIIEATMKVAMDKVAIVDWIIDSDLLQSVDRIGYLLWMGVRNNEPKPQRGAFVRALLDNWDGNFEVCMNTLQLVNPFLLKRKVQQEETPPSP